MQTTFANPLNVKRLTIGITNAAGTRVEIVLTKTNPAPYAPLAPVMKFSAANKKTPGGARARRSPTPFAQVKK